MSVDEKDPIPLIKTTIADIIAAEANFTAELQMDRDKQE